MKNCPYCKAEIADEANFCLYCMRPLEEKELIPSGHRRPKGWLFVLGGILLLAMVFALLLWLMPGQSPANTENDTTPPSLSSVTTRPTSSITTLQTAVSTVSTTTKLTTSATSASTTDPTTSPTTIPATAPTTAPTTKPIAVSTTVPTTKATIPSTTAPTAASTTKPTTVATTVPTTVPTTAGTTSTTAATTKPTATATTIPTTATTAPTTVTSTAPSAITYSYRLAQPGDDFSATYQNPGNHIVITGVTVPSPDGVYRIPAAIDGKQVIAIAALAFDGINATAIYLPQSVKTVAANAFIGCAVTDIYFTHNIYIDYDAFPASSGALTIHCPKNVHNRAYAAYRSNAHYYKAQWEEWNGEL